LPNLKHILLNNGSHDSVGGQPTVGGDIDFAGIAKACGYNYVGVATTKQELIDEYTNMKNSEGPGFLEVKLKRSTRSDLGRPKGEPRKNKEEFMRFVNQ